MEDTGAHVQVKSEETYIIVWKLIIIGFARYAEIRFIINQRILMIYANVKIQNVDIVQIFIRLRQIYQFF